MTGISLLLERWVNFVPPDETVKRETIKIIEQEIGVVIEKSSIKVTNGVVHIDTDPTVRCELYMRQKTIQEALRAALGKHAPLGVR